MEIIARIPIGTCTAPQIVKLFANKSQRRAQRSSLGQIRHVAEAAAKKNQKVVNKRLAKIKKNSLYPVGVEPTIFNELAYQPGWTAGNDIRLTR